jgi:hypothetical protein
MAELPLYTLTKVPGSFLGSEIESAIHNICDIYMNFRGLGQQKVRFNRCNIYNRGIVFGRNGYPSLLIFAFLTLGLKV